MKKQIVRNDFQINPLSAYKNKHNWHLDEIDWIERESDRECQFREDIRFSVIVK